MDEHDEVGPCRGRRRPRGELEPVDAPGPDMSALAEELVASATERGIALTGDGGLLTALTKQVLQRCWRSGETGIVGNRYGRKLEFDPRRPQLALPGVGTGVSRPWALRSGQTCAFRQVP